MLNSLFIITISPPLSASFITIDVSFVKLSSAFLSLHVIVNDVFQGNGSGVVSVSCFGVRVSVMFHFMFVCSLYFIQFGLLGGHLLGNSCPLG